MFEPVLEVGVGIGRPVQDAVQRLVDVVRERHRVLSLERQRDLFEIVGQGLGGIDAFRERLQIDPVLHVRWLPLRWLGLFCLGLRLGFRLGLFLVVGREFTVELLRPCRVEPLDLAIGVSAVAHDWAGLVIDRDADLGVRGLSSNDLVPELLILGRRDLRQRGLPSRQRVVDLSFGSTWSSRHFLAVSRETCRSSLAVRPNRRSSITKF